VHRKRAAGTTIIGENIFCFKPKESYTERKLQLFPSVLTTLFSEALKKQMNKICEQKGTYPTYYLRVSYKA